MQKQEINEFISVLFCKKQVYFFKNTEPESHLNKGLFYGIKGP